MPTKRSQQGFTLIEATLVLGTVSLVAAGIMATRSIVRTAQIQSVMGEAQMYISATKNFKSKYLALPGDYAGAGTQWGEMSYRCSVGSLIESSTNPNNIGGLTHPEYTVKMATKTCSGNGNGEIQFDATHYEHINAWRHLGLSGFISQNFTGSLVNSSACAIDIRGGQNVPASRLKGASWNIGSNRAGVPYTSGPAGNQYFPINTCTNALYMNALWIGGSLQDDDLQPASCAHSQIPTFTGREAYDIDAKFDDKRAGSGKIRAQYNNTASTSFTTCFDSSATSTGGYKVVANGVNCSLAFIIQP